MKRPILVATISYINGIIIGVYLCKSIPLICAVEIIAMLTAIIKKNKYKAIIITYITILIFSSIYVANKNKEYENKYLQFDDSQIKITGIIISDVKETDYMYTFTVKTELPIKSKNDNFIVSVKKSEYDIKNLKYGNQIKVVGTYNEPSKARNYKGFDYKNYLKTKKIYGTIQASSIELMKENNLSFITLTVNNFKNKIKSKLGKILPEKTASLAMGILLGDDSSIDEGVIQNFKNSNLSHMLAVSGTHVAYVLLTINLILEKKIIGIRWRKIITILVMLLFMLLTGMTPSVVRAGMAIIIHIIATLIYRKSDTANTIAISALLTLMYNPFNLFNIGMQLSYAGTISIILFYSSLEDKTKTKNKIFRYILESTILSISANIFIIPIMAYYFNTISLTFIFSNLLAGPVLGISMILGIIVVITSFISLDFAGLIAIILNLLLSMLMKISEIFSGFSLSKILITTPTIISVIAYYFLGLIVIYRDKIYLKIRKKLIPIIMIIIIISNLISMIPDRNLTINFVDVGQGDCSLITTQSGKRILIDGGGATASNNFDVGNKTLLPYLLDRKIRTLDYIIVSHFDSDHCQGLEAVIDNLKVKKIVVCKQSSITNEYKTIMKKCIQKNIQILTVKRENKMKIDSRTYLEFLHPSDDFLDDGKGGLNANAIVCMLSYKLSNNKYFKVLFTGDIEEEAEKQLEEIYGEKLKCDVLKVAHHRFKKLFKNRIFKTSFAQNSTDRSGRKQ